VRVPVSGNVGIVSILIFTVTSGIGTTTPSGTFTWQIRGQQIADASGTFSAKLTEIDQYSFIVSMKENYSNFSETQTISLTKL